MDKPLPKIGAEVVREYIQRLHEQNLLQTREKLKISDHVDDVFPEEEELVRGVDPAKAEKVPLLTSIKKRIELKIHKMTRKEQPRKRRSKIEQALEQIENDVRAR